MDKVQMKVDTLMCVGSKDIDSLFSYSVISCFKHFSLLGNLYIVTPDKKKVLDILSDLSITSKYVVLDDKEVLSKKQMEEDGWYRQQMIKLSAYKICNTKFIASLCSDTVLLKNINYKDFFDNNGNVIQYYRNHKKDSPHSKYEKSRAESVAKTLKVNFDLCRSKKFYDLIIDFKMIDSDILRSLNNYLKEIYGSEYFLRISPGICKKLEEKKVIAEWTLYGIYLLDIFNKDLIPKAYEDNFITQIHSPSDLARFNYDAQIVHFVNKNLNFKNIQNNLNSILSI